MPTPTPTAQAILAKHWDGKLPVDVFGIARKMGVALTPFEFQDDTLVETGLIQGKPVIRLSKKMLADGGTRPRFAVAHALGHVVLHSTSLKELTH